MWEVKAVSCQGTVTRWLRVQSCPTVCSERHLELCHKLLLLRKQLLWAEKSAQKGSQVSCSQNTGLCNFITNALFLAAWNSRLIHYQNSFLVSFHSQGWIFPLVQTIRKYYEPSQELGNSWWCSHMTVQMLTLSLNKISSGGKKGM